MQNPVRETQTLLHSGALEGQWDCVWEKLTERRGGVICTDQRASFLGYACTQGPGLPAQKRLAQALAMFL